MTSLFQKLIVVLGITAVVVCVDSIAFAQDFCGQETATMYNELADSCVDVMDSCAKEALTQMGYAPVDYNSCEAMKSIEVQPRPVHFEVMSESTESCLQVRVPVIDKQTGVCQIAMDGCQLDSLLKSGLFSVASQRDAQSCSVSL